MVTQDLLKATRQLLVDEGMEPVLVRRLSELDKREGLCIRTNVARARNIFIDGSRDMELPLRIVCKYRSAAEAMSVAEDVVGLLDGTLLKVGSSVVVFGCDGDATQELELNDSGFYAWEADVTAYYTQKGSAK